MRANAGHKEKYKNAWITLFSAKGDNLRAEFENKYEKYFTQMVQSAKQAKTKLIVLYIPSTHPESDKAVSEPLCRKFYKRLTDKHGVEYLDLTDTLRKYDWNDLTLLPQNGHLCRYGNRVVAKTLNEYLRKYFDFRSPVKMTKGMGIFGGLKPSRQDIWNNNPAMAYRVYTNRQGFRKKYDLKEKKKQRILILGDSFTFGPFVPNHDTYPTLLEHINPQLEVINGAVCGYSIPEEYFLFHTKAKHVAPDITILQVLDNDLYGFFYFKRNQYDLERKIYTPSTLEESFLKKLEEDNKAALTSSR